MRLNSAADLEALRASGEASLYPGRLKITVGMATCGLAAGADAIFETLRQRVQQRGLDAVLARTGCIGFCQQEPLVDVRLPGAGRVIFTQMTRPRARALVDELSRGSLPVDRAWAVVDEEELPVSGQVQR